MRLAAPVSTCEGVVPLPARREPWMDELLRRPELLAAALERHGSPLNLIDPEPLARNLGELEGAASAAGVTFRAFFARKANKSIALLQRALALGAGADVASLAELEQSLGAGAAPEDVIVTAAIKPRALLELCVEAGVVCAPDNADEAEALASIARLRGRAAPVALRLAISGGGESSPPTRFGLDAEDWLRLLDERADGNAVTGGSLRVRGLHFHVDGYAAADRARGLGEALRLADALRDRGHEVEFVDIGGGIPMSYLEDREAWREFRGELRAAVRGERNPFTYEGHRLGLEPDGGGEPRIYPGWQEPIRGEWLASVLAARAPDGATLAAALRDRGLELRCEPGRSLLDGCGMTLARVEFRKRGAGGEWLVGAAMNRTQCRSAADDLPFDPLLVPGPGPRTNPIEGCLVGAYCIERELICWRRLRFGAGVAVGDVLAIPNTAGYFMHILESSSHQMPLAQNLLVEGGEPAGLDPIDAPHSS